LCIVFLFSLYLPPPHLLSFPTRRSSDLSWACPTGFRSGRWRPRPTTSCRRAPADACKPYAVRSRRLAGSARRCSAAFSRIVSAPGCLSLPPPPCSSFHPFFSPPSPPPPPPLHQHYSSPFLS